MVKYYGPAESRVGEYRSAKLGAQFSAEEFVENWGDRPLFASPAKDMAAYLSRAGNFIDIESCDSESYHNGSYVYHFGGATVVVKYSFCINLSKKVEKKDAGDMTIRLASNAPLDHVVEKLKQKFPYLQDGCGFDGHIVEACAEAVPGGICWRSRPNHSPQNRCS